MKGFYRQEGEARKLLAIEKKRLFRARSYSFGHKGENHQDLAFLFLNIVEKFTEKELSQDKRAFG